MATENGHVCVSTDDHFIDHGFRPEKLSQLRDLTDLECEKLAQLSLKDLDAIELNLQEINILQHHVANFSQAEARCCAAAAPQKEKSHSSFRKAFEKLEIHGIKAILEAGSVWVKLVWLTVYFLFLAAAIHGLYGNLVEFYTNPILTSISITEPSELEFPELVLCPTSFFNGSYFLENAKNTNVEIMKNQSLQYLLHTLAIHPRLVRSAKDAFVPGIFKTLDWNQIFADQQAYTRFIDSIDKTVNGTGWSNDSLSFGSLRKLMPRFPTRRATAREQTDFLMENSFKPEAFFKYCEFGRKPINCSDIIRQIMDPVGVCYLVTVNKTQDNPTVGLRLLMDIHSGEGPLILDKSISNKSIPLFSAQSFSVMEGVTVRAMKKWKIAFEASLAYPGTYSKMNMNVRHNQMISTKMSKTPQICTDILDKNNRFQTSDLDYSKVGCEIDCQQTMVFKQCGCALPFVDISALKPEYHKSYFCNVTEWTCVEHLIRKANCASKCFVPCTSWEIDIQQSAMRFPDHIYLKEYQRLLREGLIEESQIENNPSKVAERYIYLDIAFARIQYTSYLQSPSLTMNTIFSNAGGTLGLWLGASLFTIIQFFMLIVENCLSSKVEPAQEFVLVKCEKTAF